MDNSLFKPIKSIRVSEEISDKIKELIVDSFIKPGDKLPSEAKLADQFRVSRQTIREALRLLELSGFIKIQRGANGGPIVVDTIFKVIIRLFGDAFRMRNMTINEFTEAQLGIENAVLSSVFDHITQDGINSLKENISRATAKLKAGQLATDENLQFHKLLAMASKNQVLLIISECMIAVYRDFLIRCKIDIETSGFVTRCHKKIFQGIQEDDRATARKFLKQQLLELSKRLQPL